MSYKFAPFHRLLALLLAIVLLAAAPASVLAAARALKPTERQRVEGAIEFLATSGYAWAAEVREWLDEGRIMADPKLGCPGVTNMAGRITIRANLLDALPEVRIDFLDPDFQARLMADPGYFLKAWVEEWKSNVALTLLLIHEMTHVHQAPSGPGFKPDRYLRTDWNDSITAYRSCTGPDALEVEAYYTGLLYALIWLNHLQQATGPPFWVPPRGEAIWLQEHRGMLDFLEQVVDEFLGVLDNWNYEKADKIDYPSVRPEHLTFWGPYMGYLSDAFRAIDDAETIEHDLKVAFKLEQLNIREIGLLSVVGPYHRMRQAAQAAREVSATRTAAPDAVTTLTLPGCDAVVVAIPADAVTAPTEVTLGTLRPYPPAPPGFSFVVPPGATSPVFRLEGEGLAMALFHVMVDASGLPGVPALWQLGPEKPAGWHRLPAVDQPGITVAAAVPGNGVFAVLAYDPSYTDISPDHTHYREIEWLRRQNVMRGMGGGIFGSGMLLQRAQFAALIVRALDLPRVYSHGFTDVAAEKWYAQEGVVATVRAHNLLRGYSAIMFGPEDPISREQVYTVLVRAVGLEGRALDLTPTEITELLALFLDAGDISPWARPCLAMAVKAGLWPGEAAVTLGPMENMDRDEAAGALYRLMARLGRVD